ncbi:hypothetical protein SAMN05443635_101516 [Roseobacter denitrificans OCh 114]|nr:hypothetical protein SAMN05443635_101516 [Roseobacter denitrificans OCh 114]
MIEEMQKTNVTELCPNPETLLEEAEQKIILITRHSQ